MPHKKQQQTFMEKKFKIIPCLALAFGIVLATIAMPVSGQSGSNTICTGAMMRSFSSCVGFLSGGSNASSPTAACCDSLRSLMSNGQDCLCLIVTGGVPFQVPLNRTLAMSLPRACRMSGVPVECKATASPIPAPDPNSPGLNGPSMSPGSFAPPPRGQSVPRSSPPSSPPGGGMTPPQTPGFGGMTPPQTPGSGGMTPPQTPNFGGMTPPQTQGGNVVPTLTPPGMRPTLTPSAAQQSHSTFTPILLAVLVAFLLNCY